jgi:hypothetical protein
MNWFKMKIRDRFACSCAFVLLFALFQFMIEPAVCQNMKISSNTILNDSGGRMILSGNILNDGSFLNNDNTLILTSGSHVIGGTTPVTFNNLTISSGGTATITTPGEAIYGILLSNGILNAGGNLTLLSTAEQTALIDGSGTGQVSGNLTMQRYLPAGFGYKYFSSPFQASQVSEFSDNMKLADPFPAFYSFDESLATSGWITYIDPAGLLNPLEGYAINFGASESPIVFDVSGTVNNGSMSKTLYNHNNEFSKGFSLVGNPYPSPIDWDAPSGWTKTNIDDALYFFQASSTDEYGGTYVTYANGVSSNDSVSNIIPSMQGFFVHVSDGTYPVTGTYGMNNEVRINDLTHPLIKSGAGTKSLVRLIAEYSNDTLSADPVVIYFDEKATANFDGQLDALKLMNTDWFVTNFYTIGPDGKNLSICALPVPTDTLCTVPLGLSINTDGKIVFRIKTLEGDIANKDIYIYDKGTGSEQDLKSGKEYSVDLAAGEYNNRFYINFHEINTGIENNTMENGLFRIYGSNGILKMEIISMPSREGTLRLYDLTGQVLLVRDYYEPGFYELSTNLKKGLYIAGFRSGKRSASVKFIF